MKMKNKIWFRGSFKWTQSIPFHGVDGIGTRQEMRPDGVAFYANLFCHVMMSMSNATSWQDCYFSHLSTVDSCVLLEHCWVLLWSFGPPFQLSRLVFIKNETWGFFHEKKLFLRLQYQELQSKTIVNIEIFKYIHFSSMERYQFAS